MAVTRRSEGPLKTRLREIGVVLSDNRTLVLWALWIALGAAWAYVVEGWDAVTSLYFAVGGLATGGLQAPSLGADGTLPRSSAVFVALYCLSGIPIFAMALGQFASVFVQRILAARERAALKRTISPRSTRSPSASSRRTAIWIGRSLWHWRCFASVKRWARWRPSTGSLTASTPMVTAH